MADTEKDDPAHGKPWANPRGGYQPWDTDTFAPGSYGAPFAKGGAVSSETKISVAEFLLQTSSNKKVTVMGVIKAELNDEFGLELADTVDNNKTIAVKIPASQRDQFSPKLNPSIIGIKVLINGTIGKYMGQKGMKSVKSIKKLN